MATLAKQTVGPAGATPAYVAAAAGGDKVQAGAGVFIHVKNGGGSSINVIIDDPTSASPAGATQFNPDVTVAVPNGSERMIAVPDRFTNPNDGLAAITYSAVTSVTVGAFAL